MNNQNDVNETKQTRKSLLFPILSICVILVVAIGAVTFVLLSGNDKKNSAKQTSVFDGIIEFENPISDYLGSDSISQKILSGESEMSGELILSEMEDDTDYSGAGIEYSLKRDAIKSEMSLSLNAKYREANVLSTDIYMNKDKFQFKVPSKAEDVFTVTFDKLIQKMEELVQSDEMVTSEQAQVLLDSYLNKDAIASMLGDWSECCNQTDIISTYIYAIQRTYPKEYKEILNGISVEKAENDAYGNAGITYTISEDSIELFFECLLTVSFDDKELNKIFKPYIESYATAYYITDTYEYAASYDDVYEDDTIVEDDEDDYDTDALSTEECVEKLRTELESIDSVFSMFFNDDITVTVWKNKNGLLTGLNSENELNIAGESFELDFYITTQNDANPTNNMDAGIVLTYEGESLKFLFNRATTLGETLSVSNSFSIVIPDENTFCIASEESLNTTDNHYDYTFSLSEADTPYMQFKIGGAFDNLIRGNAYNLVLDDIGFIIEDETILSIKGNISIDTASVDISAPTGTQTELTDLSEDELNELFEEVFGE